MSPLDICISRRAVPAPPPPPAGRAVRALSATRSRGACVARVRPRPSRATARPPPPIITVIVLTLLYYYLFFVIYPLNLARFIKRVRKLSIYIMYSFTSSLSSCTCVYGYWMFVVPPPRTCLTDFDETFK